MCGFSGIVFSSLENKVNSRVLSEMNSVIEHRGPDDEGYYISDNIGLAFRRLSIIDLNTGNQPMCDINNTAWIVFNGEIYNYKSLRKSLQEKGYSFRTSSDTEVVLIAYIEYGDNFVQYLRGMFAFAIWDSKQKKIILGRDRFGIKPLNYILKKGVLVFGSEIKSLLKGHFSDTELDWQAVDSFFSYGYILNPLTIYKDIRKLPPGHLLTVKIGGNSFKTELKRYWRPHFVEDSTLSFTDYKILIKEKLKECVGAHMVSDVPVGAFLSGGIDSNAIVSNMMDLSSNKIKTFTIGFNESDFDEAVLAKKSASFYGTDHEELYLEPESANILEKIIEIYDEPFADSSAIPTYFVSKLASRSVKVVLSGDGGDELFGGYNSYKRLAKLHNNRALLKMGSPLFGLISKIIPSTYPGRRFLYSLTKEPDLNFAYTMGFNEIEKRDLFHPDITGNIHNNESVDIKLKHYNESTTSDFSSKMMEMDILTFLVDDLLTKVDRASMANSLEVRVPIIDHEFFELASKVPSSFKIKGETGKYIFRESIKEQIPDFIYKKEKTGFTIPIHKWFKSDLNSFHIESLQFAKGMGIINPFYIEKLLNYKNLGSLSTRIWPIILFANWYRNIHKSASK